MIHDDCLANRYAYRELMGHNEASKLDETGSRQHAVVFVDIMICSSSTSSSPSSSY